MLITFTSITVHESFPDFLAVENRDQVERVMQHMPHILKRGAFGGLIKDSPNTLFPCTSPKPSTLFAMPIFLTFFPQTG